jgi:xanthine dehydrogenase small subunit
MSLFVEQHRRNRTGPCDPKALSGNLCRCTGYRPIRDAALALGPAPDGPFVARLARPASPLHPVAVEAYRRPATVDECVAGSESVADVRVASAVVHCPEGP